MSEQNYLGLGVVFKGIDDGFNKSIKDARKGLGKASAQMDKLKESMDSFSSESFAKKMRTTSDEAATAAEGMVQKANDSFKSSGTGISAIKAPDVSSMQESFMKMPETLEPISTGLGKVQDSLRSFGVEKDKIIKNILWFNETAASMEKATKGPASGLNNMKDSAAGAADAMANVIPKQSKGLMGMFGNSLSTIGNGAKYAGGKVKALGTMVRGFTRFVSADLLSNSKPITDFLTGDQNIAQYVKDWDKLKVTMGRIFSPKDVNAFMKANLENLKVNGVSADEAARMAMGMNSFGMSLKETTKVLPMMGQMVGVLGMNADNVARMFGQGVKQLKIMPTQMTNIVKKTMTLGKAFGFVDMVEDLPELIGFTADAMNKLGGKTRRSADETIMSLSKLSGQYRKMGLDSKSAAAASGQFLSSQTDMQRSIKRMNAGMDPLNDNFFELTAEMSRAGGLDFNQAQEMLNLPADKLAEEGHRLYELAKKQGVGSGDRFEETWRAVFGDTAATMLINGEELGKAGNAAEKAAAAMNPNAEWDKAIASQKKSFDFSDKLLKANRELLDIQTKFAIKNSFLETQKDQTKQLQYFQDAVADVNSELGEALILLDAFRTGGLSTALNQLGMDGTLAAQMSENAKVVEAFAKGLLQAGGGATFLTGLLGGLLGSLGSIIALVSKVPGLFGGGFAGGAEKKPGFLARTGTAISKTFPKAISAIKVAAKWGGRFLGIAGSALAFAGDFMDAKDDFSKGNTGRGLATVAFGKTDPNATFKDVASNVGSQALKWGGLGATIGSFIAPGIGTAIGAGIGAAFGAAGALIKQAIDGKWIDQISDAMAPIWEKVKTMAGNAFGNLGEMMGAGLSGFGKWVGKVINDAMGGLKGMFENLIPDSLEPKLKAIFSFLEPVIDKIKNAFASLKEAIAGFFSAMSVSNDSMIGKVFNRFLAGAGSTNAVVQASVPVPNAPAKAVAAQTAPMQKEAPMNAALGAAFLPTTSEPTSPGSTDSLISAVMDMKLTLQKELQALAAKPVNVTLVGDAAKFFKEQSARARDAAGRAGNGEAIAGAT